MDRMDRAEFKMESVVKDRITSFTGKIVCITLELGNEWHYGICPLELSKEGKAPDWHWFAETRIELITEPSANELGRIPQYVHKFGLMDTVEDIITGFTGTIISVNDFASGCTTYKLVGKKLHTQNGCPVTDAFQQERLRLVERAAALEDDKAKPVKRNSPGGINHPSIGG